MIALIRKNKSELDASVVFAEFLNGVNSQVIVFDSEYKKLIYAYYWEGRRDLFGNFPKNYFGISRGPDYRKVFVLDTDKCDWDTAKGYSWLLEDKNALKAIRKGKEIYSGTIKKCRELQETVHIPEWRELARDKDVDDIMECTFNFHNAAIVSVLREDGQIFLEFDIDGECRIIMRFPEDGSELNIDEPWDETFVGEKWEPEKITDAKIFYREGFLYWVGSSDFDPADGLTEELSWFKTTKMEWKIIIDPLQKA